MDTVSTCKQTIVDAIADENPIIAGILRNRELSLEAQIEQIRTSILQSLREHPKAYAYYTGKESGEKAFFCLSWRDFSFIRMLDYLEHEGEAFSDANLRGAHVVSSPIATLKRALVDRICDAHEDFYLDLLHLFRQLNGIDRPELPSRQQALDWMARHPSGLDQEIIKLREENKARIINLLYEDMSSRPASKKFPLPPGGSPQEAIELLYQYWETDSFHLSYAVRNAEDLHRYLAYSLSEKTLQIMREASQKGIPIFITPYVLSLMLIDPPEQYRYADSVIRDYVLYSQELVEEFGMITAWEKEDIAEPGKPNAAGWILPSNNIHRRYPNVAIFIPSTMGRACGGLCAYCQRMYDFQNGRFNFDLDRLRPNEKWPVKLKRLMKYFEEDSHIQDILITGGDAMMSSVDSLRDILDAVYTMAVNKIRANRKRPDGKKYAEIVRVRLGTKIPIYLPHRITADRVQVLADFKRRASDIGIRQFIIQTHYSSAMEITPQSREAVKLLLQAGWTVTNQEVFTVSASRRGHTARLRQVLADIGVLPYYTFTVKGYHENKHFFANNSRSIQEQIEEKSIGRVDPKYYSHIRSFMKTAEIMQQQIDDIRNAEEIPFLATDRNTINLPGVGKSNTYRTIGITKDGRRILAFDQDHSRPHSPIIDTMGKVIIIESKSVAAYMRQLEQLGESPEEYESIWGYSAGYIETRIPVFDYPGYIFTVTDDFTNLELPHEQLKKHQSHLTAIEYVDHDSDINEGSSE
ncbi:MAG: KamA family radical SAM protein [Spirochaetota bacterium]